RRRSAFIRAGLAVLVSGLLVAWLLSKLDAEQALSRLRGVETQWLAVAAACSFGVLLCRSLRFSLLTRDAGLPVVTASIAVQVFMNRITPLRLGELALPYLLQKYGGEDNARSLVHLLLVRLIDLGLVAAAVVLSALFLAKG